MDTKGLTPAANLPSTAVVETHIMPSMVFEGKSAGDLCWQLKDPHPAWWQNP
jgi:hypothetical protein